jgi:hypothetical protein
MSWATQPGFENSFTVLGGLITAAEFYRTLNASDYSVSLALNYDNHGDGSNYLAFYDETYGSHGGDGVDQLVWGPNGVAGAGFIYTEGAAPVPEPSSILLLGTVLARAPWALKRKLGPISGRG